MRKETLTEWRNDAGRSLLRKESDGTYMVLPSFVTALELADLRDAIDAALSLEDAAIEEVNRDFSQPPFTRSVR